MRNAPQPKKREAYPLIDIPDLPPARPHFHVGDLGATSELDSIVPAAFGRSRETARRQSAPPSLEPHIPNKRTIYLIRGSTFAFYDWKFYLSELCL